MRHFKLPLIVTGVVFALVLIVGVAGVTMIHRSAGSSAEKERRAGMLGTGAATLMAVTVAPFWLFAAAKVGKERRAAKGTAVQAAMRPVKGPPQTAFKRMPPRR